MCQLFSSYRKYSRCKSEPLPFITAYRARACFIYVLSEGFCASGNDFSLFSCLVIDSCGSVRVANFLSVNLFVENFIHVSVVPQTVLKLVWNQVAQTSLSHSLHACFFELSFRWVYTIFSISVYYAFCTSYIYLQNAFIYWSPTGMSTLTHPFQHYFWKGSWQTPRRSWRHCQHWKQNNHQPPLCWWHWWLSRRRRTVKISWVSRQSLHSLRHGDQCWEDQADDNTSGINTEIKVNGQKLETVTSFKYPDSVITDEGSKREILSKIAQTTAALTRLKPIWNDRCISLSSKTRMMHSIVTSIFLHAGESWIFTAELQRRIRAMKMRCYRKVLRISYKDHVTNEGVPAKIQQAIGLHEDLLTT